MWHSVRLFYYDEDTDHLLVHGIAPALRELRAEGLIRRAYVMPHWKQGPHLRINLEAEEGRYDEQAWPRLRDRLTAYLRQYPSATVLDEAEYAAESEDLGHTELEPGPYLPLFPNNTLHRAPYQIRSEYYSGEAGAAIAEDFLCEALDAAVDGVQAALADPVARYQTALRMMIGSAGSHFKLRTAFLCFRSHFEGFLGGTDPTGELRQEMEAWYQAHRAALVPVITDTADQVTGQKGFDPFLAAWVPMVKRHQERYESLFTSGAAAPVGFHEYRAAAQAIDKGMSDQWDETPSDYHRYMYSIREVKEFNQSARREAFRYVINLTYSTLVPLGISAFERYQLCYVISHALEEYFGATWLEITEEALARQRERAVQANAGS